MPSRKRIAVHYSNDIQGDDSWIKVAEFTIGEWEAFEEASTPKIDPNNPDEYLPLNMWQIQIDAITQHLLAWNWVDDNGNPMPLPTPEDASSIRALTKTEIKFIVDAIVGNRSEESRKNSASN